MNSGGNSGGLAADYFDLCGNNNVITVDNCNFTGDITNAWWFSRRLIFYIFFKRFKL